MARHNFTDKTKRAARARAGGYCEAVGEVYGLPPGQRCNALLDGKAVEIDHYPIPATEPGSNGLENAVCCCLECHRRKTNQVDAKVNAKVRHNQTRHAGIRKPTQLQSRGFDRRPKTYSPATGENRRIER